MTNWTWLAPASLIYIALQIPFLFANQGFNGSEGVYWQVLRQLQAGHTLYSEVYCTQFPLFVELARFGRFLPFDDLPAARIMMALFAPFAILGFYTLLREKYSPTLCGIAAGLLAIDPFFFNLTHQLTGEVPALALTLWGVIFFLRSELRLNSRAFWISILLFFLAIQIKPVFFLMLIALAILWSIHSARSAKEKAVALVANASAVGLLNVLCLWYYGFFHGLADIQNGHFQNFLALMFSAPHHLPVAENIEAILGVRDYARTMLYVTGPCFVLALIALFQSKQAKLARDLLLGVVLITIPLFHYVVINPDHLILYSPLAALAMAALFIEGVPARQNSLAIALSSVLVLGGLFFTAIEYDFRFPQANKSLRRATAALEAGVPEGSIVMGNLTFLITAANRLTPPEYTDLSPARMITKDVTCESLEERFKRGGIQAFVFRFKGIQHIDCGMESFRQIVGKYFPKNIYSDGRVEIFTVSSQL